MKKRIFVFLFDGFSDWEISFLTPEINKNNNFKLVYFSTDGNSVKSMGGMEVVPATSLNDLKAEDIDLLVLPGGTTWEQGGNKEIEGLTKTMAEKGKPVAAICAATTFLGRLGLLDNVKHTSNDLNYLKMTAPGYSGEDNYEYTLAVTGNNIITACGIAPIEFAREIFKMIELYDPENIEKWFQLFKNGIWSE